MRRLVLSALLLSAFPLVSLGQEVTEGDWTYNVFNGGATIMKTTATGAVTIPSVLGGYPVVNVWTMRGATTSNNTITSVVIPSSVTNIGSSAFSEFISLSSVTFSPTSSVTRIGNNAFNECISLTNIIIPISVTNIGMGTFTKCSNLTSATFLNKDMKANGGVFPECPRFLQVFVPDGFRVIGTAEYFPSYTTIITPSLINALASSDTFVTAVANKIKETGGNFGIATQNGLSTAIEPLATKTQITTAINEGKASGIASVTASPNTWSLFTTSQIQNMAVGDLVLTRQVGGGFVLNYDIEQSNDLQNWTTYQALSLPLTGLPTDKAFVRIKAKQ